MTGEPKWGTVYTWAEGHPLKVYYPEPDGGGVTISPDCFVEGVDPGVSVLVALLRHYGFKTTDSGDGVSKVADDSDALPYPHVFIMHGSPFTMVDEAKRLHQVVSRWKSEPVFKEGQTIEASFSPVDGVCVLSVLGISDADLKIARTPSE